MSNTTHKLAIAMEFLDTAATLWVHNLNYFSAIHLAAAAEEIAGKACRIKRTSTHFDDLRISVRETLKNVGISHTEQQIKHAFYGVKNSIKHMDSGADSTVTLDPKKEAADYIVAAFRNFEKLGLESDLSAAVKRVVNEETLHIETDR